MLVTHWGQTIATCNRMLDIAQDAGILRRDDPLGSRYSFMYGGLTCVLCEMYRCPEGEETVCMTHDRWSVIYIDVSSDIRELATNPVAFFEAGREAIRKPARYLREGGSLALLHKLSK